MKYTAIEQKFNSGVMRILSLLIIASIFISSCVTHQLTEWETDLRSSGYDFRSYTERGFLFTPEIYTESYEAIGLVEITYVPEIREHRQPGNPVPLAGYRILSSNDRNYYIELPETDNLIEEMYNLADGLGADALSNFRISPERLNNNNVEIETIKVSGFAIKRL